MSSLPLKAPKHKSTTTFMQNKQPKNPNKNNNIKQTKTTQNITNKKQNKTKQTVS